MVNYCDVGGEVHQWCYPDFDADKQTHRICLYCKLKQCKEWVDDKDD